MIRLALLLVALALPAQAEQVVAGLSQDRIAITANFRGSEILIFGAVKREVAIPEGELDVIVTVEGPLEPVTVRHKTRRMGIWINTEAVEVDHAPSFYAVATTGPMEQILSQTEDLRHAISVPRAIRSVGAPQTIEDSQRFTEALIRIRESVGNYSLREGAVELAQDTLFRTQFDLPANLTEGSYKTRIFLMRERRVIDLHEATIDVRMVGLERWLFTLAHEQPAAYGLLSLFLAVGAGWAASAAFRFIRV